MDLSDQRIRAALAPFGVLVSGLQIRAIREYVSLLLLWNQKVNLTSVSDPLEILGRHFGESQFAAITVPIEKGRLADVGSGGGFPGLALKIACPALEVVLIERSGRKAAFLTEVKGRLSLSGVEVRRQNFEDVPVSGGAFEFVTSRAIGQARRLVRWSQGLLSAGGKLILWLGAEDAIELASIPGWAWREPIPIPKSVRRVLLIGSPLKRS